jgi:hypothetical protein
MKRLMLLMLFGMLLGGATGCRVAECWRYAWNSRFHPQQQQQAVVCSEPCVVSDSCASPCSTPCGTTPMSSPTPIPRQ